MNKLKRADLAKLLADKLANGKNQRNLPRQIAAYLVQTRRTSELDAILRGVTRIRQSDGTIEATVTTAFPLNETLRQRVKRLLAAEYKGAQTIIINNVVEPAVLSGVAIQTIDKQYDQTAQRRLSSIGMTQG